MAHDEADISLKIPSELVEKLDAIAKQKYLKRSDIIIDACAFYCQFHDMNRQQFPETMRNIFCDLARHDDEFRKTLREVLRDDPTADFDNLK
ncbi:MAG: ribbon-helix-helix domain-containing protein [Methanoregula sp.]|jgi:metal-responsive CopG/Arc/MetJ family transcriptional regulator